MTVHAVPTSVARYYRAIESGQLDALDELCAPSFGFHFPGLPRALDLAATKGFFAGFGAALADLHHAIEDVVADDTRIAVRLTISGVHQGDLNGIPPTGNRVAVSALNLFHVADGRLAAQWVEYDGVGLLQQLGVVPQAA